MTTLTSSAQALVHELAEAHGFTPDGVKAMLDAVARGGGTMAQFDHPDFGGSGQWMQGGMLMTSDPFDDRLKKRIDGLCHELATRLEQEPGSDSMRQGSVQRQSQSGGASSSQGSHGRASRDREAIASPGRSQAWWPTSLGLPDSAGSQNDMRYAYFSEPRRLAIESRGRVMVYDTGDHRIGGASQQQGAHGSLSFTSQHGPVPLDALRVVDDAGGMMSSSEADPAIAKPSKGATSTSAPSEPSATASTSSAAGHDPFIALERLAELHQRGVLTEAEYAAKKAELLDRI